MEQPVKSLSQLVQVAVDHPIDGELTYRIPPKLAGLVVVGSRVEVPLGKANRAMLGTVLGFADVAPKIASPSPEAHPGGGDGGGATPADFTEQSELFGEPVKGSSDSADHNAVGGAGGIKNLLSVLTEVEPVPEDLLALARWISQYYCTPIGVCLATMVPAAVKRAVRLPTRLRVTLTVAARDSVTFLKEHRLSPKSKAIYAKLPELLPPHAGAAVPHLGLLESELLEKLPELSKDLLKRLADHNVVHLEREIVWPEVEKDLRIAAVLDKLCGATTDGTGSSDSGAAPPRAVGGSPVWPAGHYADEGVGTTLTGGRELVLTPDQQHALTKVLDLLSPPRFAVRLLHGVTGSGKTEVYIRAIEQVVAAGKRAIVLVPEISLTPQTVRRFTQRFPRVAVLHSGLRDTQRHLHWHAIATGWAQVIVGARSAIFAPARDLGIIVVDEEHDPSYKQDNAPRYHGRDVAIRRAQMLNIPVLLGSATPALESWLNATASGGGAKVSGSGADALVGSPAWPAGHHADEGVGTTSGAKSAAPHGGGHWGLLELPTRPLGFQMPRVQVVDMRQQSRERRGLHVMSTHLEMALRQTLQDHKQAILLLNRRGYAHYVMCPRCDWVMMCDNCSTTMVVHRTGAPEPQQQGNEARARHAHVLCHYCMTALILPTNCPECRAKLTWLGQGTQRAEDELLRKFPGLRLARMDSDSMSNLHDYQEALRQFGAGETDVLLGTQMISKGLDFPNVTLVGVLNADLAMTMPDFRAAERTFQLICQVAGRAGRPSSDGVTGGGGRPRGLVVVQTYQPQEPAIVHACNHDYAGFRTTELPHRAALGLPPYGRLARLVFSDKNHDKARDVATQVATLIMQITARLSLSVKLPGSGPVPPPMERLAEEYRWEIVLEAPTPGPLQKVLSILRARGVFAKCPVGVAVDVDPVRMM